MFDRRKHEELPKCQGGFIRFVVLPLYEELDAVCPTTTIAAACLARADENLRNWHAAEENPKRFQAVDHKQQENLRIQLALLASQKAVNRRLSYRLKGHVQIVSPDQATGGDQTLTVSFPKNVGREGELSRETRGARKDTRESTPRKSLQSTGQGQALLTESQSALVSKASSSPTSAGLKAREGGSSLQRGGI